MMEKCTCLEDTVKRLTETIDEIKIKNEHANTELKTTIFNLNKELSSLRQLINHTENKITIESADVNVKYEI